MQIHLRVQLIARFHLKFNSIFLLRRLTARLTGNFGNAAREWCSHISCIARSQQTRASLNTLIQLLFPSSLFTWIISHKKPPVKFFVKNYPNGYEYV